MSREESSGQAWLRDWLSLVEASRKTTEPPLWKTFKVYSCTDVQVYSGTVLLGKLVRLRDVQLYGCVCVECTGVH